MDLRPTWPTAAGTLVFDDVGARMAFVEALRRFPALTMAGMPVSPTGHDGYEVDGRVTDLHFTVLYQQSKLIAIDKQPDDDVMHLD